MAVRDERIERAWSDDEVPAHRRRKSPEHTDLPMLSMIREYFDQKRAAWRGIDKHGDEIGWPPMTILGKIRSERDGASHSSFGREYPEVFSANALLVRRAMQDMDEEPYIAGHLQYLLPSVTAKAKAEAIGWSVATYAMCLSAFHIWIRSGICAIQNQQNAL